MDSASRWTILSASEIGSRVRHEDHSSISVVKARRRTYVTAAVCDGIGSMPGSKLVAQELVVASQWQMKCLLKSSRTHDLRKSLAAKRVQSVYRQLPNRISATTDLGSTLVQVVTNGGSWTAVWAGDSRAYSLHLDGTMEMLTTDHSTPHGSLTSYIRGDGHIVGTLSSRSGHSALHATCICLTSDGVHDACSREELRAFLVYCVHKIRANGTFKQDLAAFLSSNVSDNFTMCIAFNQKLVNSIRSLGSRVFLDS